MSKFTTLPKASLPKGSHSRKDKTVCSEEELRAIQKERNQNQVLSLNKPYLKSLTDLKPLTKSRTKFEKSERSERSERSEKKKKS